MGFIAVLVTLMTKRKIRTLLPEFWRFTFSP